MRLVACLAALLAASAGVVHAAQAAPPSAAPEVIAEVIVHGNHIATDAEIVRTAGVHIGDPFGPTTLADVRKRVLGAGGFDEVDVLKRFASIADVSKIAVVIVVNEGPVKVQIEKGPGAAGLPGIRRTRVVRRNGLTNVMFLPILDAEDGYGFTYGAQLAYIRPVGKYSRLSFPLTWGGTKQAGVELERTFSTGPLRRLEFGARAERRRNPAYDERDDRRRLWARAEESVGPLRLAGEAGWQHVSFGALSDDVRSAGVDVELDTRLDPLLPRNAVYLRAGVTAFGFASGGSARQTRVDGQGYLGLVGQTVLVVRATRDDANRPLAAYLKPLLGGWSNLRGFEAGAFVGDTRVTGSLEFVVPLSSPLDVGKFGFSVFADSGKSYDKGRRFRDEPWRTGVGAGVWFKAAVFHAGLSAAHALGAGTRVNFEMGVTF